jgi:hypothetical protein
MISSPKELLRGVLSTRTTPHGLSGITFSCENDLDVKLRRVVRSSSHYALQGSGSLRVDCKTSHPAIVLRLRETSAQKLHELF